MAKVYSKFPEDVFDRTKPVELDIETNGLNPFRPDAKIHCMALSQDPSIVYWIRIRKSDYPKYISFFKNFEIICRRGTFECTWIRAIFKVKMKLYFDTKVGAFLIDENRETGLKDEAVSFLKVPYWDDVDDFQKVTDWPRMKRYNSRDVIYDLTLFQTRHRPYLLVNPKIARLAKYILMPAI